MSNKFKYLDIKNCTYYFFNDIINTKILIQTKLSVKDSKCVKMNNVILLYILSTNSRDTLKKLIKISI